MSDDEMHDSEDQPRHESRGTSEVSVRQGTAQRALLVFRQINLRVGIRCRFIGFLCFYGLIMPRVQQNVTGPTVLTSIEQTQ